jgi:hypothetical protein
VVDATAPETPEDEPEPAVPEKADQKKDEAKPKQK